MRSLSRRLQPLWHLPARLLGAMSRPCRAWGGRVPPVLSASPPPSWESGSSGPGPRRGSVVPSDTLPVRVHPLALWVTLPCSRIYMVDPTLSWLPLPVCLLSNPFFRCGHTGHGLVPPRGLLPGPHLPLSFSAAYRNPRWRRIPPPEVRVPSDLHCPGWPLLGLSTTHFVVLSTPLGSEPSQLSERLSMEWCGEVPCFLIPLSSSPGVFSSVTWGEGRTSHHACCSPANRLMSPLLHSLPSQTGWKVGRRLVVGLVLLTLSRPCVRCVNGCVNVWPQMSGAVFGTWSVEYLPFLALVPSISAGYSQTPAQFLAVPGSGRAKA